VPQLAASRCSKTATHLILVQEAAAVLVNLLPQALREVSDGHEEATTGKEITDGDFAGTRSKT
jgi:hypothetical protein